jgi:hypothetical protein
MIFKIINDWRVIDEQGRPFELPDQALPQHTGRHLDAPVRWVAIEAFIHKQSFT